MKIFVVLASLFIAGFSNAGHRSDLRDVAHSLDRVTNNFLHQVEHDYRYHHIVKEATKLAWRANHFHKQVEQGVGRRHLRKDFRKTSRRYHDLVNEYHHERYHDPRLERKLRRISRTFKQLQYAMNNEYYASRYNQNNFYQKRRWGHNRDTGLRLSFSVIQ